MSKHTNPLTYRLGISCFWLNYLASEHHIYAYRVAQQLTINCFKLLNSLFLRHYLYLAEHNLYRLTSVSVELRLVFYAIPWSWKREYLTWWRRRRRARARLGSNIVCFNNNSARRWMRRSRIVWLNQYHHDLTIRSSSQLITSHMRNWSRIRVWRRYRQFQQQSQPNRERDSDETAPHSINRRVMWLKRLVLVRLKDRLESFVSQALNRNCFILLHNLHDLFMLRKWRLIQQSSAPSALYPFQSDYLARSEHRKRQSSLSTFGLIQSIMLHTFQKRLRLLFRKRPTLMHELIGLCICGCTLLVSRLLLKWLTTRLTYLKKKDLYLTRMRLCTVFTSVARSVCQLISSCAGFRLDIYGKCTRSLRTTHRSFVFGNQINRQKIMLNFSYDAQEAYTFSGTINCKLWLLATD